MDTDALVSGIFGLAGAAVYTFVGWRLSRRRVSPEAQLSAAQFGLFWLGLAAFAAVGGVESLVAAFVLPSLAIVVTLIYVELLVLSVVLWALVGYLVYLFTGRNGLLPLSALYGALFVLLMYFITASDPNQVVVSAGSVTVTFSTPVGGPFLVVLYAFLILPEFIGSILYFTLFFRTHDRTVRYRVAVVSWSLILWFGLSVINVGTALGGSLAAQSFARSLGVLAGLAILAAYYPPRAWRTRYGIRGIDEPELHAV